MIVLPYGVAYMILKRNGGFTRYSWYKGYKVHICSTANVHDNQRIYELFSLKNRRIFLLDMKSYYYDRKIEVKFIFHLLMYKFM